MASSKPLMCTLSGVKATSGPQELWMTCMRIHDIAEHCRHASQLHTPTLASFPPNLRGLHHTFFMVEIHGGSRHTQRKASSLHLEGDPVGALLHEPGASVDAVCVLGPVHAAHTAAHHVNLIQSPTHQLPHRLPLSLPSHKRLRTQNHL